MSLVVFLVAAIQYSLFTLSLERRVVWHAPRSFAKYAYLVGKYSQILASAVIFLPLSGFWGLELTNAVRNCAYIYIRRPTLTLRCRTADGPWALSMWW
jgi:hypothetical protein